MEGNGIPVQFFEYKEIKCIISEDKSAKPHQNSTSGKTYPNKYDYIGNKKTAQAVKNKYIYIFRKRSNEVYFHKELKGTNAGKLITHNLDNWENSDNRPPIESPIKGFYLDRKYLKNGFFFYFCISKIKWSKERLKAVRNQLKAGYCNRVMKLPIDPEYCSRYSEEEKNNVEYFKKDGKNIVTQVFLTDYWSYIYDEHKGLIKPLESQNKKLENWLKGKENNIARGELKTLNDMVWKLCSKGPKKLDSNDLKLLDNLELKDIMLNSRSCLSDDLHKKALAEYKEALTKVSQYNTYSSLLRKLAPQKVVPGLGAPSKYEHWTEAEYWRVNFSKEKNKIYSKIVDNAHIVINWISKKEFIAMQHDYAYGTEEQHSMQTKDFSNLLHNIIDTAPCKNYLNELSTKCLSTLKKLNDLKGNDKIVCKIHSKDLNKSTITEDEKKKLLHFSEKVNKESSFPTTVFFSMRKLEWGTLQMLEALASMATPITTFVKGTPFVAIFEDLTEAYVKKGFSSVYSAKISDFVEKKTQNKKQKKKNKQKGINNYTIEDWKSYVQRTYRKEKTTKFKFFEKDGYIHAYIEPKALKRKSLDEVCDFVKGEYYWAKQIKNADLLEQIVVGFEILNVILTLDLISKSNDNTINVLSIASSIADIINALPAIQNRLSDALWGISGLLEIGINFLSAKKKKLLNNPEAEYAYYCATVGSLTVVIGGGIKLFGSLVTGNFILAVGIIIQFFSSIFAELFTHNDIQQWINHCYWGKSSNKGNCIIPSFSDTCFTSWKDNIQVQLEAAYNILYGFKISLQVKAEKKEDREREEYKDTCINIIPKIILPESQLQITIWLECNNGSKRIFAKNLIVDFKKDKQHPSISSITKVSKTEIIKKITFTLSKLNSNIRNRIENNFPRIYGNEINILNYKYFHIEVSLDVFGDKSIILPGKDKKITLHKKIIEVPWNGHEVSPDEINCNKTHIKTSSISITNSSAIGWK